MLTLNEYQLLSLYILGGIIGGILYLTINISTSNSMPILEGSSASVLAIMIATTLRSPDYKLNLFLFGEVKLKWFALISIFLILIGFSQQNIGGAIAHFGGLLTGAIFGLMLRNGRDILKPIYTLFIKNEKKELHIRTNSLKKSLNKRRLDIKRLNELLEKIKQSGYESLTQKEKKELEILSQKLK